MKKVLAVLMGLVCAFPALAHNDEPMNLDDLLDSFGWDFDEIEIRTEKVTDNFYVLFGGGGNIGVSVGAQGVLIVDDQFPELIPKIGDAIRAIGGGSVDFAVNTHWHFDHAEGNLAASQRRQRRERTALPRGRGGERIANDGVGIRERHAGHRRTVRRLQLNAHPAYH